MSVLAVVPLPPPVNGFTWVAAQFVTALSSASNEVLVIRTTPALPPDASTLRRRAARIGVVGLAYVRTLAALMSGGRSTIYIPISGGIGKLIELPFVLLARCTGAELIVHHHSFAYINRPNLLARLFLQCCGAQALHLSLGAAMTRGLRGVYGIQRVQEISNACFVPGRTASAERTSAPELRIGFFGNISKAKGILTFLEVCKALTASGVRFRGHIAGPFESEAIRRQVCSELEHLPDLKLWGAAYGETKAEFFRSIDVLLFPSHYRNEAEPVTILEALSQAVCVMATDLGCIGNLLEHAREEWIFPEAGFVERACERLARYSTNPASLAAARLQARARFEFLHDASAAQLRKLIDGMLAA